MTNIKHIEELVNNYFQLDITRKTRQRKYIEARFIYFKLAKKFTEMSLVQIAKTTKQNHATVLHGIKTLENLMEIDKRLKFNYKLLENKSADFDQREINLNEFTEGLVQKYMTLKQLNKELTEQVNKLTEENKNLKFYKNRNPKIYN